MKLLDELKKYNSICWYPSAGNDYRALMYLSKQYADRSGWKEDKFPDCFIYTDYHSFGDGDYSYGCYAKNLGGQAVIHNDGRTKVTASDIQELEHIDVGFDRELVDFDKDENYGRVFYGLITVESDVLGKIVRPLYYIATENAAFGVEFLQKNVVNVDYIVHVRYGNMLGGGRSSGMFVKGLFSLLNTRYFITETNTSAFHDIAWFNYREKIGEYNRLYDTRSSCNPYWNLVHKVPSELWSYSGDVSWYRLTY